MKNEEACRKAFEKAGFWPNEVMWSAWQNAWKQATEIEREACAKVCEIDGLDLCHGDIDMQRSFERQKVWREHFAAKIRSRSNATHRCVDPVPGSANAAARISKESTLARHLLSIWQR